MNMIEDITMDELLHDPGKKRIDEIMNRLKEGVQNIFDSKTYREFLSSMAKFHSYSVNNALLIAMQAPYASRVASLTTWNRLHRHVKKGSRGIAILCPVISKGKEQKMEINKNSDNGDNTETELKRSELRFRVGYVFDIAMTEGRPLPDIAPKELIGTVAMYEELRQVITDISPVPVLFSDIKTGAKGYYSPEEELIVIKQAMPPMQTLKTQIH